VNSCDRIKTTLAHKQPDRVPCDFEAVQLIVDRLFEYFEVDQMNDLLDILGIDKRSVFPEYIGPDLRTFDDGSKEAIVYGGPRMKAITSFDGGTTENTVYFPWSDVEKPSDLEERFGWNGHITWWDFKSIKKQIDELEERGKYWIATGGDPSGLQHLSMWVGDEKFLMMLALDEELAVAAIERHNMFRLEHALKSLEAGGGRIHELSGGGDYGTQESLLISKDMFRRYFKDIYIKFYSEIKKNFDVEVFFHSCGAISEMIPELIDIGVTILDPIQVTARNMEIEKLKSCFGEKLTFHGAIDIQRLLPYGTEEEVRREVRRAISILGKSGGYILAPTHCLQADTPITNIIAMYEEAQGRKIQKVI
jgi:uroporphyrinogen decarboxylase